MQNKELAKTKIKNQMKIIKDKGATPKIKDQTNNQRWKILPKMKNQTKITKDEGSNENNQTKNNQKIKNQR